MNGKTMGEVYPRLLELPGYEEVAARIYPWPPPSAIDTAVRDRVLACVHRGPEGGLVLLEDEQSCCGGGAERTQCRAGKGDRPGRVTLRECLDCRA
jgi:hypothetical protein